MPIILKYTLDCLDNNEFNLFARQGAIELFYNLFEQLNTDIIDIDVMGLGKIYNQFVFYLVIIINNICPTTLTNHWHHEKESFADF